MTDNILLSWRTAVIRQPAETNHTYSTNDMTKGFLALPSELRNRIYELSLIRSREIPLSRTRWIDHQPSMLRTCRQLRHETIKLFYARNLFNLLVEDYNSSICARFFRLQQKYSFSDNVSLRYIGQPHWDNLLEWLQLVSMKSCVAPIGFGSGCFRSIKETVLENMFALVRDAREFRYAQSWQQLVQLLEIQRAVLAALDCRWAQERAQIDLLRDFQTKRLRRMT